MTTVHKILEETIWDVVAQLRPGDEVLAVDGFSSRLAPDGIAAGTRFVRLYVDDLVQQHQLPSWTGHFAMILDLEGTATSFRPGEALRKLSDLAAPGAWFVHRASYDGYWKPGPKAYAEFHEYQGHRVVLAVEGDGVVACVARKLRKADAGGARCPRAAS